MIDNFISNAIGQLALEHIKFITCLQTCVLYDGKQMLQVHVIQFHIQNISFRQERFLFFFFSPTVKIYITEKCVYMW